MSNDAGQLSSRVLKSRSLFFPSATTVLKFKDGTQPDCSFSPSAELMLIELPLVSTRVLKLSLNSVHPSASNP